ncbi:MAG TPA: hypothetical protein VF902_00785 [Coriobacteriia bacterium]
MMLHSMHRHRRHHFRPSPWVIACVMAEKLFWVLAATCFLSAAHRVASATKLRARVKVLGEMGDAFTDEEREDLVHKIKVHSLGL